MTSLSRPLSNPLAAALSRLLTQAGGGGGEAVPSVTPAAWTDTALAEDRGDYIETSPLARAVFTTDATEITVSGFRNMDAGYDYLAELGVIVDGEYLQPVIAASAGAFSETIALSAGSKVIEIINGPTTRIGGGGTVLGTWLKSVSANAAIAQTFPAATNKTLFLSDSIGVGDHADNPTRYSYISRLRAVTTDSLVVYGWGFNQTDTLMGDSTKRAAMMAIVNAVAPARIVDTLGTNDWALASSTKDTLATKKAAFYDDVNASLPSAQIYAVKLTIRNPETTNGFGQTPDEYRAAFDTAATGRAWVTVVNGKAFMVAGDLFDDVHPTTGGHFLWAQGIDSHLGYVVPDLPIGAAPINAGPDANGTATLVGSTYQCRKVAGGSAFNGGFYGLIRSGDFRYKVGGLSVNVMVGLNATPHLDSGFADMEYCIYFQEAQFTTYDNGSAGASLGTITGDPETRTFWIDRTGSTVTLKQGTDYATAATRRTSTLAGSVGLDLSVFDAAGTADVEVVI